MSTKTALRIFQKHFNNAYLLDPSMPDYHVGSQFENEYDRGKNNFEIGPPFISFMTAIGRDDRKVISDYFNSIKSTNPKDASFGDVEISTSQEIGAVATIPNINLDIAATVNHSNVTRISFEKISCRTILHDDFNVGILIETLIKFKDLHPGKFKRNWAGVKFLHDVYYAEKVTIGVKTEVKTEVEAKLKAVNMNYKAGVETAKDMSYVITGKTDVPFAARIETLGDFINPKRSRR